jgi:cephalosporin-C deacetylase
MPFFDLDLPALREVRSTAPEPEDFDDFWNETLHEAAKIPLRMHRTEVWTPARVLRSYDVEYRGSGGDPIRAWWHVPVGVDAPVPTVVEFLGYSGGRGLAHQIIRFATWGYAHLVMDTRGQGWGSHGASPDPTPQLAPAQPGALTQGIDDPRSHLYRRIYVDAVRAVEVARTMPEADAARIIVAGGSQGGGIALAVAGLRSDLAGALIDVPFLCWFDRAIGLSDREPYAEIVRHLARYRSAVERSMQTLRYLDGVNFARRATAPALFSVGLQDPVCPPSTVFAAYNDYAGSKEIAVYPFNQHEGGQEEHEVVQAEWLTRFEEGDCRTI